MIKPVFKHSLPPEAKAIRQEVFVQEQGFKNEFDDVDASCWHLVLFLNETPISTGRLQEIDPETYKIGRVAVKKAYRGCKIGTYTVKFLCTKAKTLGARKVILYSQLDKVGFYKKIGFREFDDGEVYLDEGCPHVKMYKILVRKKAGYRPFY